MSFWKKLRRRDAPAPGVEIGWGGARLTGGLLQDEHNAALQGAAGVRAAARMRRVDAQVRAVISVIELPLRSTPWMLEEPPAASAAEREATGLLRENLFEGLEEGWDDLLRQAALAIYYGYAVPELVWEEAAGLLRLRRIAARSLELVEQWLYDQAGRPAGFVYSGARACGRGLEIESAPSIRHQRVAVPLSKSLHLVYGSEAGSPTGFGLWRSMYPHWYIKDALYRILSVGIERNLLDVPVGRTGAGAQADDRQKLLTLLTRWRAAHDAAVVLTEGQELEFIGSQRGLMDAMPFLHHHNVMIAQAGLAQFLNLGHQGYGTQALAGEHVRVFEMSLDAAARWIQDAVQRQVIARWMAFNYGTGVRAPRLRHRTIRSRDQASWASVLATLTGSGFLHPDEEDETHLRELLELPASHRAAGQRHAALRHSPAAAEVGPSGGAPSKG